MTQKELSKASGVSQVTISFLENELSEPMDLTKKKLADALGTTPEELFPPKKIQKRPGKLHARAGVRPVGGDD